MISLSLFSLCSQSPQPLQMLDSQMPVYRLMGFCSIGMEQIVERRLCDLLGDYTADSVIPGQCALALLQRQAPDMGLPGGADGGEPDSMTTRGDSDLVAEFLMGLMHMERYNTPVKAKKGATTVFGKSHAAQYLGVGLGAAPRDHLFAGDSQKKTVWIIEQGGGIESPLEQTGNSAWATVYAAFGVLREQLQQGTAPGGVRVAQTRQTQKNPTRLIKVDCLSAIAHVCMQVARSHYGGEVSDLFLALAPDKKTARRIRRSAVSSGAGGSRSGPAMQPPPPLPQALPKSASLPEPDKTCEGATAIGDANGCSMFAYENGDAYAGSLVGGQPHGRGTIT